MFGGRPGERGPCPPSFDRARRYFRTSSKAKRLLTVERAANFIAVAFATISAWVLLLAVLKDGTIGVLTMEAQFPLPALYGERSGRSEPWLSGATIVVCCRFVVPVRGERSPAEGGGCMNWPIGACPDEDLGREAWSLLREPQGDGGGWLLSFEPSGPDMVGAASEARAS